MVEYINSQQALENLYKIFVNVDNTDECRVLLADLCTPSEIKAMTERLWVAYLLFTTKLSYRQIHELTKVSIATITRVARFLNHEKNKGYQQVLEKMLNNDKYKVVAANG